MKRIILVALIFALTLSVTACGEPKKITGNEWLKVQESSYNDLQSFTEGVDQVVTLYVIESISKADFEAEVALLKEQYALMVKFREKLKKDNPIEPESHSYVSIRGTEAIEKLYDAYGEIIDSLVDENGQAFGTQKTAYRYLASRQNVQTYISEYITALQWLNETITDIEFAQ